MPNELPVPPELQHLVEKREGRERRKRIRRRTRERRKNDLGLHGSIESIAQGGGSPIKDRRSGKDRRKAERRKSTRRRG